MIDHIAKTDIQLWKRIFDIIEGDNIRAGQIEELGGMVLEIQQRYDSTRERMEQLEAAKKDNEKRIAELEARLNDFRTAFGDLEGGLSVLLDSARSVVEEL